MSHTNPAIAMFRLFNLLNIKPKFLKIFVCLVLLYPYWYFYFGYGLFILIMAFTYYAYVTEVGKITTGDEYFKDDNIFFRYGKRERAYVFPIRVKDSWSVDESRNFADGLIQRLIEDFKNLLSDNPMGGKHVVAVVGVFDQDRPKMGRGFLKSSFTGTNGAIITNMVTYQLVGKTVALHHETYTLGIGKWYDILYFVMVSPITILFWIYPYFKNVYSLRCQINREVENSFEQYDLDSFYCASIEVVTETLKNYLKEHQLYFETIERSINNFITNMTTNNIYNYGGQNTNTINN